MIIKQINSTGAAGIKTVTIIIAFVVVDDDDGTKFISFIFRYPAQSVLNTYYR